MNRNVAGWITHRWVKWIVLVVSLVVIVTMAFFGSKLTSVQDNDIASWLPGDAESTQVIKKSQAFANPDDIPAVVLYTREGGITDADKAKVAADIEKFKTVDTVDGRVSEAIESADGDALEVIATLRMDPEKWEDLPDRVDDFKKIAERNTDGLSASIAGPAALGADQSEAFAGIDGILLLAALLVVVVMLLLTYRSPVLWLIPFFCGLTSVFTAQGFVYLLAKAGLTVNGQSSAILSILVLGAGIDYALLLVARYREELRRFEDRHEAMAHALHRAGPAIIASGATVMVGLLCLVFAQMNSTASLGPVTAAGILVALAMMMILLPALLVIFGRWVFWPFIPRFGDPERNESGLWGRVGKRIARRPRAVWVVTALLLGAATLGVVQLDANGLSNEEGFTTEQPSAVAEKKLAEHFPGGAGSPVAVIANGDSVDAVQRAFAGVEGIDPDSVTLKSPPGGPVAYLEGTLTSAPDSAKAYDTIDRVRDAVHEIDGADALVGGNTAINKDVQEASSADNRLIIPIVLVAVFLILAVLLRALAAPLILLVTVVLSFGAAIGISALVFRHVFDFAGTDSSFPLFAFVFLVALGIDYNIFLMTRVREEALEKGTRRGALIALGATGGVITSAGLVLAGTFAALGSLPLVFLAELGFAVALGVLLDTVIVRSVLVTALNLDIGRHIWWPSQLAKKEDLPEEEVRTPVSV